MTPGSKPQWRRLDGRILAVLGVLALLSLLFLHSAGYDPATGRYVAFWKKQLVWYLLCAAVLVVLLRVPYRAVLHHAWPIYGAGVGLLLLVLARGTVINHARRWIDLRFMLLQPSEFMKVILVIALARYIRWRDDYKKLRGLVRPFAIAFVPMALILRQPDLGTALLFVPVLFVMLFVAGARARHLLLVALMGLAFLPVVFFGVLKDYQRQRILVFLGAGRDEPAAASAEAYHLVRSEIAVGSGGFFGKGLGEGDQRVPYNETDFIFTVIAEEWGFMGSLFVILLYVLLLAFTADTAISAREPSGKLLTAGVFTLLLVQTSVNIGMTVGLAPITGLTLPFLSYGGSSLLSLTLALALVLNVRLRPDYVFTDDYGAGPSPP